MKELSLRHQLINDIRLLSPDLLSQAYHYLELLKASESNRKNTWRKYASCISDKEAQAQKRIN